MVELRELLELIEAEQVTYRSALDEAKTESERSTLSQNREASMAAYRERLQCFAGEKEPIFMQQLITSGDMLYVVKKHYKNIKEREREVEMRKR